MALTTYVEGYARLLAIGQEVLHVERQQAVLEDAAGNHRVLVLVQHRKVAVFRRLHRVGQLQLGNSCSSSLRRILATWRRASSSAVLSLSSVKSNSIVWAAIVLNLR